MKWNENLYCTHDYHLKNGKPRKLKLSTFIIKNCSNCDWLTEKKPKRKQSKGYLKQLLREKNAEIKKLTESLVLLEEKHSDLKRRYRKLLSDYR